jgi:hypothetical protein
LTSTLEDLRTVDGKLNYVAIAKLVTVIMPIIGAAAGLAYKAAVSAATSKTEAVVAATKAQLQTKPEAQDRKDESEASFQALLKWKADIDRRLPVVERAVARTTGRKPAKVVPRPFPTSTAQALQQIRGTPAAVPAAPVAAPAPAPHMDASP